MRDFCSVVFGLALFSVSAASALAQGPSFDCSKATHPDERAICSNAELSKLDVVANAAFEYVRHVYGHKYANSITLPLLRMRHACGSDVVCIKKEQLAEIKEFRSLGAPAFVGAGGQAPSFDCAKARGTVERTICNNPELARLDKKLASAFESRYSQLDNDQKHALLQDERHWIELRNGRCDVADFNRPVKPCIEQMIKQRIAALQAARSAARSAARQPSPRNSKGETLAGVDNAHGKKEAPTSKSLKDANAAFNRFDYRTAMDIYHSLAEQGDAAAQNNLGVMYEYGYGVLPDDSEAAKWYRKAADQGDSRAHKNFELLAAEVAQSKEEEAARERAEEAAKRKEEDARAKQEEAAFILVIDDARSEYNSGANDLIKGAARVHRREALCKVLKGVTARRWSGTVATLSSSSSGLGVLVISIGHDIAIGTTNNDISNSFEPTLLDPSSNVFKQVAVLSVGQRVVFSGSFLPSHTDCVQEMSLTQQGSMTDPEFLFRFSSVEAASETGGLEPGGVSRDESIDAHYSTNEELCTKVVDAKGAGWSKNPNYAAYVAEAEKRGLTIDACREGRWSNPASGR